MKRFLILAAMAATLAISCTKSEIAPVAKDSISFQPANYAGTKVNGSEFPLDETFSAYAWTAGAVNGVFMDNVTVSYNTTDNHWKPSSVYYWPGNNQAVDFFCYYPANMQGITVATNKITYDVNFANTQADIMYADKAVGFTQNANTYNTEGVPTLFRHAAAKLAVNVTHGNLSKTENDGAVTRWEITLKGVNMSGIYVAGTCELNLSSSENGIIPWTKPTDADGYAVWTHTTATNSTIDNKYSNTQHVLWDEQSDPGFNAISEFYVLPQTLVADQQKITLQFDVKTYRTPAGLSEESLILTQEDVTASANLLCESIPAWQMNHSAVYTIVINPTGSYEPKPIFFDPSVAPWADTDEGTISIDLNL